MNVDIALKKINTHKQEKKNLLVKLFDANELITSIKIENMSLIEKVKSLESELSVAREQLDVRISALKSYCMMLCMLLCMTLCMT